MVPGTPKLHVLSSTVLVAPKVRSVIDSGPVNPTYLAKGSGAVVVRPSTQHSYLEAALDAAAGTPIGNAA